MAEKAHSKRYISITLTDDLGIQELNKQYLNRDEPTDVLSFEIGEQMPDGTEYLGDVIVNTDQAKRQSADYGNTYEEEISELVAHGVLHLLGVHHPHDDEGNVHGVKVVKK